MAGGTSPEFLSGLAFGIVMVLLALVALFLEHRRRHSHPPPVLPLHSYPHQSVIIHYHNWHQSLPAWWAPPPRPQIDMPRRYLLEGPTPNNDRQAVEVEEEASHASDTVSNQDH